MKKPGKHIILVSIELPPPFKLKLDRVSDERGMTIKTLMGRLIAWFSELDRTQQSVVLRQLENADATTLAAILKQTS